jgi:tetratricopeptide (TPR) repeat protein
MEQAADIAAAVQKARAALQNAQEHPRSRIDQAIALVRLAKLKFRLGNYKEAVRLARATLELVPEDSPAHVQAWLLLGNCAAEAWSLQEAEGHFQRVIELSCKYGLPELRFRALNSLSMAFTFPEASLGSQSRRRRKLCASSTNWI